MFLSVFLQQIVIIYIKQMPPGLLFKECLAWLDLLLYSGRFVVVKYNLALLSGQRSATCYMTRHVSASLAGKICEINHYQPINQIILTSEAFCYTIKQVHHYSNKKAIFILSTWLLKLKQTIAILHLLWIICQGLPGNKTHYYYTLFTRSKLPDTV